MDVTGHCQFCENSAAAEGSQMRALQTVATPCGLNKPLHDPKTEANPSVDVIKALPNGG
ncbi:hypothetical protein TUM12370_21630 [Salmonella enterica subsp. enterica serovar Choleraesuis]|nr:hypothetical protein TUM12370_21630 [Salmonella enterica subsp. enterica serovar Choleraesuis]